MNSWDRGIANEVMDYVEQEADRLIEQRERERASWSNYQRMAFIDKVIAEQCKLLRTVI